MGCKCKCVCKCIVLVGALLILTFCLWIGPENLYYDHSDGLYFRFFFDMLDKFMCRNSTKSIYVFDQCDGIWDCPYGDDESMDNCGRCHNRTFLCENSTMCMSNSKMCDGISDCPYSDDETIDKCVKRFNDDLVLLSDIKDQMNCDISDAPGNCVYVSGCVALCRNYTDIPQNLSSNVTEIVLRFSSLSHLSRNSLSIYPELRILNIVNNGIVELEKGAFLHQTKLVKLNLGHNRITNILPGHLTGLHNLEALNLGENKIVTADFSDLENSTTLSKLLDLSWNMLTTLKLPQLPALRKLDLSWNMLTTLKLPQLPALRKLQLYRNRLESITDDLFAGCPALEYLDMKINSISNIDENAFQNLQQLRVLSMGFNPVTELSKALFNSLNNLESLYMNDINLDHWDINTFKILSKVHYINFMKFRYCVIYASHEQTDCSPIVDGVSSLSHLLDKPLFRTVIRIISFVTCLGNILVLWERSKNENRVLSIIIRNLAVSDMLMGIYLFIIVIQDMRFRDNYKEEASRWIFSWYCTFLGALAMTSSEVSVLIMSFMSVERFIVIAAPFKCHRAMKSQAAILSMIIIWIVGLILALIPVIYWRNTNMRFYGDNGMCFPLHIDDPYMTGWEYSAFIFLGVNFLGMMIIGYVYAAIFASIWKTRRATPLSDDSKFALRFFLIVLTDAACWAPIITFKIRALMKYHVPYRIHAWLVVFFLPVNSAINPLLYTFTTPKFCERFNEGFGKLRSYISRKYTRQASQALATNNIEMAIINENARQSNVGEI